nr:MAG TPA: hypothetical protein [Caudoviricetes sp.]
MRVQVLFYYTILKVKHYQENLLHKILNYGIIFNIHTG